MSEVMIVLSKPLSMNKSKVLEKKLLKLIDWVEPIINMSEECEIMINGSDDEVKDAIQRVKEFAEKNGYEMEVINAE